MKFKFTSNYSWSIQNTESVSLLITFKKNITQFVLPVSFHAVCRTNFFLFNFKQKEYAGEIFTLTECIHLFLEHLINHIFYPNYLNIERQKSCIALYKSQQQHPRYKGDTFQTRWDSCVVNIPSMYLLHHKSKYANSVPHSFTLLKILFQSCNVLYFFIKNV